VVRTTLDLDIGVTEAVAAARAKLDIGIVRIVTEPVPSWAGIALELPATGLVLVVERVIRVDGTPAVHGLDLIPLEITAGRASAYDGGSVYRFLEQDLQIQLVGGLAEVTAVAATLQMARDLAISRSTPLLRLDQVERSSEGRPVLFSREHYVPGVFSLMVHRFRRQQGRSPDPSGEDAQAGTSAPKTEVQPEDEP
jgi:GntR family transcriptional regulator